MKKSGMYAYFHCKRARGCDKLLVVDVKEVTGLKKKLCMVCLLAALLTAGCTQNGQEPAPEDEDVMTLPDEEQADEETKEEQKNTAWSFQINSQIFSFPSMRRSTHFRQSCRSGRMPAGPMRRTTAKKPLIRNLSWKVRRWTVRAVPYGGYCQPGRGEETAW